MTEARINWWAIRGDVISIALLAGIIWLARAMWYGLEDDHRRTAYCIEHGGEWQKVAGATVCVPSAHPLKTIPIPEELK